MKLKRVEWDGKDARALAAELRALAPALEEVGERVAEIIAAVGEGGNDALVELSEKIDGVRPKQLRVDDGQIEAASKAISPEVEKALAKAAANVRKVADAQLSATVPGRSPVEAGLDDGHKVAIESIPVSSAGAYAPGGRAAYPSTVLMCAIPAKAAGVERVAIATPPDEQGEVGDLLLAACAYAEVGEVYAVGGAQAIAALALGTETIDPVDVVVGPGNRYVQEAKRQLVGRVGIDGIAGPSELMVVFDDGIELDWVALDLIAQGEHGDDGLLVAATADEKLLDRLEKRIAELVADRPSYANPPLALVAVPSAEAAIELANALAPEHLELACDDADELAEGVRTAGCVFTGAFGGTAFGDYVAGSNHVLPTGGAGRFQGPLGPDTFRRRISLVSLPAPAATELAPHVKALADAEGLPVHGESAMARAGESTSGGEGETR